MDLLVGILVSACNIFALRAPYATSPERKLELR